MTRLITLLLAIIVIATSAGVAAAYENDNDYSTYNPKAFYWRQDEARGAGG
jgi:hypothetical protein